MIIFSAGENSKACLPLISGFLNQLPTSLYIIDLPLHFASNLDTMIPKFSRKLASVARL